MVIAEGRSEPTPYVARLLAEIEAQEKQEAAEEQRKVEVEACGAKLRNDPRFPNFGKWLAVECVGRKHFTTPKGRPYTKVMWRCQCQCEYKTEREVDQRALMKLGVGSSRSCGRCRTPSNQKHQHCSRKFQGKQSPLYKIWNSVKRRAKQYNVPWHEPWNEFANFLADLGERPSDRHILSRKKLEKGYVPKNFAWKKKRKRGKITYKGETLSAHAFAKKMGMSPGTLYGRLERDTDVASALEAKPQQTEILVTYKGKTQNLSDWSRETGIGHDVLRRRHELGWTPKRMLTEPVEDDSLVLTHEGKTQSLSEWAKEIDVPYSLLFQRLKRNEPVEQILNPARRSAPVVYITHDGVTMNASQWAKKLGVKKDTLLRRKKLGWSDERIITEVVGPSRRNTDGPLRGHRPHPDRGRTGKGPQGTTEALPEVQAEAGGRGGLPQLRMVDGAGVHRGKDDGEGVRQALLEVPVPVRHRESG